MTELTEMQQKFVDILLDDNITSPQEAAKLAGYAQLSQAMKSKNVQKHILDSTQKYLATNAPKAVKSLLKILDEPDTKGGANAIAAAKEVLDRGGLAKKDLLQEEQQKTINIIQLPPINKD